MRDMLDYAHLFGGRHKRDEDARLARTRKLFGEPWAEGGSALRISHRGSAAMHFSEYGKRCK